MPRCPNPRCQADYPPGTIQCTNPFCQCLLPEAVIAGRYRIETLIGMGGMGAVYRASDTFETTQVALKVLSLVNSSMESEVAVERFRREARYAHQLTHKNIVPVLNFGQDGPLLYLAMPLVMGGTLKALLKAEQPLPLQQARGYLNDLAEAIDAIHAHPQQIVHRDIKPSNLLIHQDDGRLVVADFGIARAMSQDKPLTQRGWSLGTEHYIAPEQQHGDPKPASDIYSMGVVAYQIFTGLLPFQAVVKNRAAELPPPSTLNEALPPQVDTVVLRAMDIDPAKRFASGHEFAEALNKALDTEDISQAPTITNGLVTMSSANVIVRTAIPENPCAQCGRENRAGSRFCRHCGNTMDQESPLFAEVCQVGYVSDEGKKVDENEDMLLVVQGLCVTLSPPLRPFSLCAVADGLRGPQGTAAGGHEASRLAIETIADVIIPLMATHRTPSPVTISTRGANRPARDLSAASIPADSIIEQWISDGIRQANKVIYHCNADFDTEMASTLTVALLYKRHLYTASVGDSRVYYYNAKQGLQRVIEDNTPVLNDETEEIRPSQTSDSHLGRKPHSIVAVRQREVKPDDLILLCTDGLWKMVPDDQIKEILKQKENPQYLAHQLVQTANDAGGEGNISAIIVRIC